MDILIATGIYPPDIGGPASYVSRLALELEKEHQVKIITYADQDFSNQKIIKISRHSNLIIRYFKYFYAVFKELKNIDIVYLQGPVSEGFPTIIANLFFKKPIVLKIVGDYAWEQYMQSNYPDKELLDEFIEHQHQGKIWLMEKIERWVAKKANKIIVPSQYLKNIVEKWGVDSSKIFVIYNSIEKINKLSFDEINRYRNNLNLSNKKILFTVIRMVPWKGVDFLADCLTKLPSDIILLVAGSGPMEDEWKKYIQKLNLRERVLFLGRLNKKELQKFYSIVDLFVLATGYEGFPHVVIEALSVNLNCLISNKGGNLEIAQMFPQKVFLAEYKNHKDWINKVQNLLNQKHQEKIDLSELSFQNMAQKTIKILDNMV